MGNFEWRDASLSAAPLRTRSGGVISTLRRYAGRCNRTDNLFQRGAIHSSRDAVVIKHRRTTSSYVTAIFIYFGSLLLGIAEVNDLIEETLTGGEPGGFFTRPRAR